MKITRRKLRNIILKEMRDMSGISSDDVMGVTEPRHDIGSPENKLLQMIHAAGALSQFGTTAEEIAASLGVEEPDVVALIDTLITPGASLASPTYFGGSEGQEDWPEDEEGALHLSTPKEKPQYNWHHSRYKGK